MATELEIRDGSPHWYLSPDIWIVMDPNDITESMPVAGTPCYLKARVRNNGNSSVTNATVKFYWGNPAIGLNRTTATPIGQSFVSLAPGGSEEVLCLTPWVPVFLNGGHECILAEAYHVSDPLPATNEFNVSSDRHVAQRNLSVIMALQSAFHMNFEMHNGQRNEQKFFAEVKQVKIETILKQFPHLKKQLDGKKEGKLEAVNFTEALCLDKEARHGKKEDTSETILLTGFEKKQMAISGVIHGDYAFITISQMSGKIEKGGLGILIINSK
jgi:hypothetical protein